MGKDEAFKDLHDHRGQGNGSVIIKACDPRLFGDGNDDGGLEAGWYLTVLQGGVEDVTEHRGQLVCTKLQDGG